LLGLEVVFSNPEEAMSNEQSTNPMTGSSNEETAPQSGVCIDEKAIP
jgi:hypothetical protein